MSDRKPPPSPPIKWNQVCRGNAHLADEDHGSPLCPDCDGAGVVYDDSRYLPRSEEPRDCLALALHGHTRGEE